MSRLDELVDTSDPVLKELRRRVQQCKPHVPEPGDADYLTPEQIAYIRAAIDDDGEISQS